MRNRLVLSLCLACGLAAVAQVPAAFGQSAPTIHAVADVGDEVHVRVACKTKEAIQAQVDTILEDKNYQRASVLLQAAQMAKECMVAHRLVSAIVVQVGGPVSVFVDSDGDTMSIQVVMIEVNGQTFWSVDLRKLQGA